MNKINLAEILKNCPKGMELDCIICNDAVILEEIAENDFSYPIRVVCKDGYHYLFTEFGEVYDHEAAKCAIFPKGKTTWEGFVPPCKFEDGDILASKCSNKAFIYKGMNNNEGCYSYCGIHVNGDFMLASNDWTFADSLRFATEEEKQKLFDAIKENGYKWNAETKTLEKLIVPKFKVGDRIKHIVGREEIATVKEVEELHYNLDSKVGTSSFSISLQDEWELLPNKFDVSTLKPFDKVLVRDKDDHKWKIELFSSFVNDDYYGVVCLHSSYNRCIPYEGNEHLLGTTNDCDKYYKTWE